MYTLKDVIDKKIGIKVDNIIDALYIIECVSKNNVELSPVLSNILKYKERINSGRYVISIRKTESTDVLFYAYIDTREAFNIMNRELIEINEFNIGDKDCKFMKKHD